MPALSPVHRRRLLLAGSGIALVVVLVLGMLALLRPILAKRRAIAEVRQYALADRRVEDPATGLSAELPSGWFALRSENPYVVRPGARVWLANPTKGVYGAVSVAVRPAMIDDVDAHLGELLTQRLARVVGKHDFSTFRASLCQAQSPVKTLTRLDVSRAGEEVRIVAEARSFLHHQVRNMVGTLRLVGEGKWSGADVLAALELRDRSKGGPTAPAHGLYLTGVKYEPIPAA